MKIEVKATRKKQHKPQESDRRCFCLSGCSCCFVCTDFRSEKHARRVQAQQWTGISPQQTWMTLQYSDMSSASLTCLGEHVAYKNHTGRKAASWFQSTHFKLTFITTTNFATLPVFRQSYNVCWFFRVLKGFFFNFPFCIFWYVV